MHIFKSRRIAFLATLLLMVATLAPEIAAAPAGNLFSAEVPVSERTNDAKRVATRRALAEVLIKVSGDRAVARSSQAQIILDDAESYVQQFRYTANSTLLVGFDGRKLQNDLRVAGLPVWGADRPATLMWLAVDYGNGERRILAADEQGEIRNEIELLAASRGIPLVWPLYDSVDRAGVEVADIWGGFSENIIEASRRYATEAVLVARVSRGASGPYYGSWELKIEGDDANWRGGFRQSVNRLADYYAERLASTTSNGVASQVPMTITGVSSALAYAEAINAVEKLGAVERVKIIQVNNNRLVLDLSLRGDAEQVRRALGLSRVLAPDPDSTGTLAYRYAR